uniref:Pept_C1 domain-containing protein n=1 Tax=Haemonchus placei TaxID=6290 RepID=A0A158QPU0_HAEPC
LHNKYFWIALCISVSISDLGSEAEAPGAPNPQTLSSEAQALKDEALVKYLNENQNLFKAKITTASHSFEHRIMSHKFKKQNSKLPVLKYGKDANDDIPPSFDSREHWPDCPSLKYVRDQANCGSCWAVSSAGAMSDRICIATKGAKKVILSATDILSCCGDVCGDGCEGGYATKAWEFFKEDGVVSGGNYLSKGCCRPYPVHPCGEHHGIDYGECLFGANTPECHRRCQPGFRKQYRMNKFYGKSVYLLNGVEDIQRDIMKNGPVVALFEVFEDFNLYNSGIYKHTAGESTGWHAVKVVGWGSENNTDFWIIANSWNDDWGEQGFFRIIRGVNECTIEEDMIAGLVDDDVERIF